MINKLLAYQEIDGKKKEIEKMLAQSESRKKMAVAKRFLETVEEKLAKLEARASDLNALFESAVASQKKYALESQDFLHAIDDIEGEKEANYLVRKLDELSAKLKNLDEEIVKLEKEIKSVLAEYSKLRLDTNNAKQQYVSSKEEYAKLKDSVKDEVAEIEKQLAVAEKEVEPNIMAIYKKKRLEDKIYPVLYSLKGNVCGSCYMELPGVTIAELQSGKIVECDQCKRLLFIGE